MNRIREGLTYLRGRRVTAVQFQRQFGEMLLMGLLSKGYAHDDGLLRVTDAGSRLLADVG